MKNNPLNSIVSFGLNLKRPTQVEDRTLGRILDGHRVGEWRRQVDLVRSLSHKPTAQQKAKQSLPFFTPAGRFRHVRDAGLLEHSGQVVVDLDGLTSEAAICAIKRAVEDRFCLAAWRSVRDGVKLLFRVPPVSAAVHSRIFSQVAKHVRREYGIKPDMSGRNVARLCFVSWDAGLWLYPQAEILPVSLVVAALPKPRLRHRTLATLDEPVALPALPDVPGKMSFAHFGAFHLGQYFAPSHRKPDGTVYTHRSLSELGKPIAMHACKQGLTGADRKALEDEAFAGWMAGVQHNGHKLRCEPSEYRQELRSIVRSSASRKGIVESANTWTRWLVHPEFPAKGAPEERLLFAIRKHCKQTRTKVFFLGCRDAALIAGVKSTRTSAKLLHELRRCKLLSTSLDGKYSAPRFNQRHAQRYRLLA